MAKMPTSDQVFNFFLQLDAVIDSVSMIPVELIVFGVFLLSLTSFEITILENFHVALRVGPMTLMLSGG